MSEGSFGCTFDGPLPMKGVDSSTYAGNYIGKVMSAKNAEEEYEQVKILKETDLLQKFGIYGRKPMPLNEKCVARYNLSELNRCKLYREHMHSPMQIVMKKGDSDLASLFHIQNEYVRNKSSGVSAKALLLHDLFAARNLFQGLAVYHAANVIHADIKPLNVVYEGDTEFPLRFKFIDFGIATTTKKIMDDYTPITFQADYYTYQPLVIPFIFNESWDLYNEHMVEFANEERARNVQQFGIEQKYISHSQTAMRNDIKRALAASRHDGRHDDVRVAMAKAADVYGVAAIVYEFLYSLYHIKVGADDGMIVQNTQASEDERVAPFKRLTHLLARMFRCDITASQAAVEYDEALLELVPLLYNKQNNKHNKKSHKTENLVREAVQRFQNKDLSASDFFDEIVGLFYSNDFIYLALNYENDPEPFDMLANSLRYLKSAKGGSKSIANMIDEIYFRLMFVNNINT